MHTDILLGRHTVYTGNLRFWIYGDSQTTILSIAYQRSAPNNSQDLIQTDGTSMQKVTAKHLHITISEPC